MNRVQTEQKTQVRVWLRPKALENATLVSQNTGRSLSDVIEDALLRATPMQMEIGMRMPNNKTTQAQFLKDIEEAKKEAMKNDNRIQK